MPVQNLGTLSATPLHRDGQVLEHLHSKNPRVHILLPPAWLCFSFSLQDREKTSTGSATFSLLMATEAAQILNHENNMEKWSRMEMEGSEPARKVPRSWQQGGRWSRYWHTTNIWPWRRLSFPQKSLSVLVTFLSSMGTQAFLPFPDGRQIVFHL